MKLLKRTCENSTNINHEGVDRDNFPYFYPGDNADLRPRFVDSREDSYGTIKCSARYYSDKELLVSCRVHNQNEENCFRKINPLRTKIERLYIRMFEIDHRYSKMQTFYKAL